MTDVEYDVRKLCEKHNIRLTDRAATDKAPWWGMVAEAKGMRLCIQDRDRQSVARMMLAALTNKIEEQQ